MCVHNRVFVLQLLSKINMLNKDTFPPKTNVSFIKSIFFRLFNKLKYLLQGFNLMAFKKKLLMGKKYIFNLKNCLYMYKKYANEKLVVYSPISLIRYKNFFLKKPLVRLYKKKLLTKNTTKLKKLPFNAISQKNSDKLITKMLLLVTTLFK